MNPSNNFRTPRNPYRPAQIRNIVASSPKVLKANNLVIILGLFILLGAGCDKAVKTTPVKYPLPVTGQADTPAESVAPLSNFMERRSIVYNDGRTATFLIVKLAVNDFRWGLAEDSEAPKTVMAWREALRADLVINGTYFTEMMQPTGYYHAAGATSTHISWPSRDEQKDDTGYTGLVQIVDGQLNLYYLPDEPQKESAADVAAFLTFPTLVAGGESLVKTDSQKYAHRTILAKDSDGTPYIIITENGLPSLYETAEWLVKQPENFTIAVNLDGGPSTGISYADEDIKLEVTSASVPNVIYIKKANSL